MRLQSFIAAALCAFALTAQSADLPDWPEFRGPTAQGIAEGATPPVEWGAEKNIAWKRAIPGIGWSSPVLYQGGVYLMTALLDGEEKPTSLRALRVDGKTGAIVWDVEVFPWTGPVQKQPVIMGTVTYKRVPIHPPLVHPNPIPTNPFPVQHCNVRS